MIRCRCCNENTDKRIFSSKIFQKEVNYFECKNCEYVFTEKPTWLNEAYSSSINDSDTGIMTRNLSNVSLVLATLTLIKDRKSSIVDYAGGHGFLVRLLRDIGIDALWLDPYSKNLVAKGFEFKNKHNANLVTAFECFEHFEYPIKEMTKLLNIAPNILLTTSIIPKPTPNPLDWWYYGLDHGQHIGFFRLKTLQYIANKFNLYLISDGDSRHFFSKQKYSYQTWRVLILLASKIPKLLTFGIKSKTWDDHLLISKK